MKTRLIRPALVALLPLLAVLTSVQAQLLVQPDTTAVSHEQAHTDPVPVAPPAAAQPPTAPGPLPHAVSSDGHQPFGAHLFNGDFRSVSFTGFNPDYQLAVGDRVKVLLWGSVTSDLLLTVDAQGNIFVPEVGPISVTGVRNADLNRLVTDRVSQVYLKGVNVYAHLASSQPVKVFVSGYVLKPGLYSGSSSDIMLYFLARAGGIDPDRGSYIDISLVRNQAVVETINLYDFISTGRAHKNQFRDGDILLVNARHHFVRFDGEVLNPHRFEFKGESAPLAELLALAGPQPDATDVSLLRSASGHTNADTHPLAAAGELSVRPGDVVSVVRRSRPQSILVSVVGEQDGPTRLVLPYGARLGDALSQIVLAPRSNLDHVQLFRKSVAARQKAQLEQALDNLARSITSTPSDSLEEAQLRQVETQTILSFVERARKVEPKGQILLGSKYDGEAVTLENGDIIYVPAHTTLINVFGEVRFPNTQTHRAKHRLIDYIEAAGGYTATADLENLIVVKTDGTIVNLALTKQSAKSYRPDPGDEVFVLPKPDTKRLQFAKDITGILYQLAISARVVLNP